MIDFYVT